MKLALLTFLILITFSQAHSQNTPIVLWSQHYGGAGFDNTYDVHQTSDGGYMMAGWTNNFGSGQFDMLLIKTNADGDTLWQKAYGGIGGDYAYSAFQTTDGGYILAGYTLSFSNASDVFVVKTNTQGDTLWRRVINAGSAEEAYSIKPTSDGGYILAGDRYVDAANGWNFYLIKLNSNGSTAWERSLGTTLNEVGRVVEQTFDGGYVIAGNRYVTNSQSQNFYLIKTDTEGNQVWARSYGGEGGEICNGLALTPDGGYFLCGETTSYGNGRQMYAVKTNANGDTVWTRNYGGAGDEYANDAKAFGDGSFLLAGGTSTYGAGSDDVYLLRLNAAGDTLWSLLRGGASSDLAYSIDRTTDGGYIIAGQSASFDGNGWDGYIIKTTADFAGTVAGTIRSDRTNELLVGARVWAEGWPDTVESNNVGNYYLYVIPGTYTVHFEKETYCDSSAANIPVEDGNTTALNMRLKSPVAFFGVTSINEIVEPNQNSSMTFSIYNTNGECPLEYEITDTSAWLSTTPSSAAIPAHQIQEVTVHFQGNLLTLGNEYQSRLLITHNAPGGFYPIPVLVFVASDADENPATLPTEFKLYSNYPNPFNASTMFSFDLPKAGNVRLSLYDIQGRSVQEILWGNYSAGHHEINFTADNLPTGIYFARMNADGFSAMQKIILLK